MEEKPDKEINNTSSKLLTSAWERLSSGEMTRIVIIDKAFLIFVPFSIIENDPPGSRND